MTTMFEQDVTCGNCGRASTRQVLGSTNAFGSPDLDLRPPEMQRSTMFYWVQRCPHCDSVAGDLAEPEGDAAALAGAEYRAAIGDERFPELARRFLARAVLLAPANPAGAGQARLCAAWACDDARQIDLARECRLLAARDFGATKPFGETDEDGPTRGAVLVDVLRRAGEFGPAASECESLLASPGATGLVRQVLEHQRRLIAGRDIGAGRLDDVAS